MPGCGQPLQTVLTDLFNEVFCDCVEPAKLIKRRNSSTPSSPCPLQARQELAQYPAGDREVCAGGGVEGLHILIFRGESFTIKEKMDLFA